MNDRFKFRAWDKEENKMYYVSLKSIADNFDCGCSLIEHPEDSSFFLQNTDYWDDEVIWMQCTGLKDKNGKLIYEGDIVRGKSWSCYYNLVVKYIKFGFYPFREFPVEVAISFDDIDNVEIIGNVNENPELLK